MNTYYSYTFGSTKKKEQHIINLISQQLGQANTILSKRDLLPSLSLIQHDTPLQGPFLPGMAQVSDLLPPSWNELPVPLVLA